MCAQLFFEYQEGKHSFGYHALQRVKNPRSAVQKETLTKKAIDKYGHGHERRPQPQPADQSAFAHVEVIELALHVARLGNQPLSG